MWVQPCTHHHDLTPHIPPLRVSHPHPPARRLTTSYRCHAPSVYESSPLSRFLPTRSSNCPLPPPPHPQVDHELSVPAVRMMLMSCAAYAGLTWCQLLLDRRLAAPRKTQARLAALLCAVAFNYVVSHRHACLTSVKARSSACLRARGARLGRTRPLRWALAQSRASLQDQGAAAWRQHRQLLWGRLGGGGRGCIGGSAVRLPCRQSRRADRPWGRRAQLTLSWALLQANASRACCVKEWAWACAGWVPVVQGGSSRMHQDAPCAHHATVHPPSPPTAVHAGANAQGRAPRQLVRVRDSGGGLWPGAAQRPRQ